MATSDIDVKSWYNDFSKSQVKTNVNLRHFTVMNNLIKAGLKKDSKVLEIGCGIGTLTGLILKYISKGELVATDISDKSIEIAAERLKKFKNAEFIVNDMSNFSSNEKFDFVVLPDVLEHIPIEQHLNIFKTLAGLVHNKSIVYINIPHASSLDDMRRKSPEKLQIIDQSIKASELLTDLYEAGFIVDDYKSYSIFTDQPDYVSVRCKLDNPVEMTDYVKLKIIRKKTIERIVFFGKRIFG